MPNPRDAFSEFDDLAGPEGPQDFFQDEGDPQKPGTATEDMVPKSRLDDVIEQRDDARQVRNQIINNALNQQTPVAPAAANEGAEVDEETLAVVAPLFEQLEKRLMERLAPAMSRMERRENLDVLNARVDGFEEKLMGQVEEVYNNLSPDMQKEYSGRVGLESLAKDILIKNLQKQVQGSQSIDRSGMAVTAPSGGAGSQPRGITEADIYKMTPEQFEKFSRDQQATR